jgi:hypothetical protein
VTVLVSDWVMVPRVSVARGEPCVKVVATPGVEMRAVCPVVVATDERGETEEVGKMTGVLKMPGTEIPWVVLLRAVIGINVVGNPDWMLVLKLKIVD